jgi:hypothetical protein
MTLRNWNAMPYFTKNVVVRSALIVSRRGALLVQPIELIDGSGLSGKSIEGKCPSRASLRAAEWSIVGAAAELTDGTADAAAAFAACRHVVANTLGSSGPEPDAAVVMVATKAQALPAAKTC